MFVSKQDIGIPSVALVGALFLAPSISMACSGTICSKPTTVKVLASGPSTVKGWELSNSNVGLARLGISCATLPAYSGPSKPAAGATISMVRITSSELDLSNGNITLDRVCVKPSSTGGRASIIFGYNPDTGSNQLGPVTIKDSDIDGSGVSDNSIYATCAFRGAGSLYRNNIWGMGSGICYFGSSTVTTSTIEQNYVHDLRSGMFGNPLQQSHNESATIRSFAGTSMLWLNNKLISKSGADSGALFIQTYAGKIQNVTLEGNYFDSFGWDLPLEAGYGNTYSNMRAIDNRFVLSGYGVGYTSGGPGWSVWSNNFIYSQGAADAKGPSAACPGGACASVP